VSDPRPPDDGPRWPEQDLEPRNASDEPPVMDGEARTGFAAAEGGWNPRVLGERRRPTTAEQAVPWLVGMVLALAGIVIVLLALIFTSDDGLVGLHTSPSPFGGSTAPDATPRSSAIAEGTPAPTPVPTPVPVSFGPLDMVYMSRTSGVAPISVMRRDFSTSTAAAVMAEAGSGIQKYTWSGDGRVGACLIGGLARALTPGQEARTLAENIVAITFGWDAETLYAVRIVPAGKDDRADIVSLSFVSGEKATVASITYPHPLIGPDAPLREAQFIDDGGIVRIYAAADGNLVVWILGAPAIYRVDVGDGTVSEVPAQPVLWSSDGRWRTALDESGGSTVIQLFDRSDALKASVTVTGLVSHVRWAPSDNEIVFTLGQGGAGGGVRQDLYVWDLADGKAPAALTSDGVTFGAEWLGAAPHWVP
jgi:hypothetical protein